MIMPRQIPDIAVIGAGVSGLACADRLAENGFQVQVHDKGQQPGGRVATSHRMGLDFEIGAPGQRDLITRLARRAPITNNSRITQLERTVDGNWRLYQDGRPLRGIYTGVVVAMPAPQAAALVGFAPDLVARLDEVVMNPVMTALIGLPGPLGRGWDHIRFGDATLEEARRQQRHPPGGPEGWVLHGSPIFSRDNLECDPHAVAQHLWLRFSDALDMSNPAPIYLRGHRWRYGRVDTPLGQPCLHDDTLGLGICGDWCLDDGVEAAEASGRALAARILGIPERPVRKALAAREGLA